jgi:DNA replication and repair protein RecF
VTAAGPQWLRRLECRDVRNLAHAALTPPADGIALIGDNGQGKTNLLEAVYYLHLLRSARGTRDVDVVRFGAPAFSIIAETGAGRTITVGFERAGKRKRVTVDGVAPTRLSDALGALPSVMFSPTDVELIRGAPSERRRFVDVVLGVTSRQYLYALQSYRAALVRRNAALRSATRHGIAVWEPPLAEHGATIVAGRAAWIRRVAPLVAAICADIGERGTVELSYSSAFADATDPQSAIAQSLEEHRVVDTKRGATQAGPHRDDLAVTLDGRELRGFGSAGQQRTAAIALRIVEAATLHEHAGAAPLMLLDDPFAELDARRAHRILDVMRGHGVGQTLLAVPRASDIPPELTRLERWHIEGGVLRREAA